MPLIEWFDPIAPEVSIVIYNRNAGEAAALTLQHLWQNTTGHRYEIILVDNGSSPDEVARLQEEAPLARVIPLGGNRYFGEASNIGVEAARGRYVCLLDSAAFVWPGWLEPLVQALDADETAGAAGPRLVQPDGALLDAGWLIDPDGGLTVLAPAAALRTPQSIDALSPACLLLRRADFLRVLGFDLAWDPGSYEAADLCLKLRLLGRHPICCPESVVMRIGPDAEREGVSDDVVALNRAKFVSRWGRSLDTMWQHTPDLLPAEAADERTPAPRPRVLIYTPYQLTPGRRRALYPDDRAGARAGRRRDAGDVLSGQPDPAADHGARVRARCDPSRSRRNRGSPFGRPRLRARQRAPAHGRRNGPAQHLYMSVSVPV